MIKAECPLWLGSAGRGMWHAVVTEYELNEAELSMLGSLAKLADRAAEAREILSRDCLVTRDRWGQEKPHPAVAIERESSAQSARLLQRMLRTARRRVEQDDDVDEFFGPKGKNRDNRG
jgi:phage terminase small subunit